MFFNAPLKQPLPLPPQFNALLCCKIIIFILVYNIYIDMLSWLWRLYLSFQLYPRKHSYMVVSCNYLLDINNCLLNINNYSLNINQELYGPFSADYLQICSTLAGSIELVTLFIKLHTLLTLIIIFDLKYCQAHTYNIKLVLIILTD